MKKSILFTLTLILLISCFLTSCGGTGDTVLDVEREITSRIVTIDKYDDYSMIYFENDGFIRATNTSIDYWLIHNRNYGFTNIWTYKLKLAEAQRLGSPRLYHIVGINDNCLTNEEWELLNNTK